ncbi:hypothetical protein F5B22DRAFT_123741 [Xylaria bambusicola]|uniref:uncharacterized protein n=1 Tax=Xylaria bambusicola TaxID=326684 RepID=UPI002008EA6A|nr:uncharacterized protein F5B22DRAFT_123741 [Xylaria bambusicola]KAI0517400.1 hypothetical protein F5B22DRAFT_123741 [Xylaria bambusicola]
MRLVFLILLGGCTAISLDKDVNARFLDMRAGGYNKSPRKNLEGTNGTSPVPQILGHIFRTRDECNNGIVDCQDYQCDQCGSCCEGGTCAENFGNCCDEDFHCSYGFACCSTGCCYQDTSFCCDTSPTGCCVQGTECTADGCVGEPAFLIESVTVTTTFTSVIYDTSTIYDTAVSTNVGVTTEFVTSTVTRDNIEIATVTNYVTSTKIEKRFLPEDAKRTEQPEERRQRPTPPAPAPSPTAARGLRVLRDSLENIGLLPKRDVTSYIYDYVFVWDTYTSDIYETSTVATEINSMTTEYSTIISTVFKDAKSTTTVESTIVVTSTEDATPTSESSSRDKSTEPVITRTSNQIIVKTTFVVGVTNSGDDGPVTETAFIDAGGASSQVVETPVSTTSSTSGTVGSTPSPEPSTSSKKSDLSTGAKAGIGAGAGAAGLALLGALVFFALGKRGRSTSRTSSDNIQAPMAPSTVSTWTPPPPPARYSHLDGREVSYTERAAALARSMEAMRNPNSSPNIQAYQPSSNFSPSSRGASPSAPSELMMGYESPREGRQEMGGTTENMGWSMGPNTVPDPQYHEMPASPEPSRAQHPRQGYARY